MRDPKTENFLTRGMWGWKYEKKVDFSKIDLKASHENPARLKRVIDDDRVIHYSLEMIDGVDFPAIVLLHTPGEKLPYFVATGMHRISAAQLSDRTALDAYVVTEADLYRRDVLIRSLNTIEGKGLSMAETIQQVVELHFKYPAISISTLSKEWGVKEQTVREATRAVQARRRAEAQGFLITSKTPQGVLEKLSSLQNDRVFNRAVEFVVNHAPLVSTVDDMCREAKAARDEATAIGVVSKYLKEEEDRVNRAKAKHGRTSPAPANKLIGHARRVNNQIERGLEHLFLAALNTESTERAKIVMEELIANAKRVITEIDRILAVRASAQAAE